MQHLYYERVINLGVMRYINKTQHPNIHEQGGQHGKKEQSTHK
jgi:hypothetical protein